MEELKILSKEQIDDTTLAFEVVSPFPFPEETRFGIDPGTTNIGVAVIRPERKSVKLYKITLKRQKKALNRLLLAQKVVAHTIGYFNPNCVAIIEGASFSAHYRQVELAEVRAAMLLWFYAHGIQTEIVPPKTIRKQVFGNGNIKNPWSNVPDDMVAALGCAFYKI